MPIKEVAQNCNFLRTPVKPQTMENHRKCCEDFTSSHDTDVHLPLLFFISAVVWKIDLLDHVGCETISRIGSLEA